MFRSRSIILTKYFQIYRQLEDQHSVAGGSRGYRQSRSEVTEDLGGWVPRPGAKGSPERLHSATDTFKLFVAFLSILCDVDVILPHPGPDK